MCVRGLVGAMGPGHFEDTHAPFLKLCKPVSSDDEEEKEEDDDDDDDSESQSEDSDDSDGGGGGGGRRAPPMPDEELKMVGEKQTFCTVSCVLFSFCSVCLFLIVLVCEVFATRLCSASFAPR
jgi:hypothetical protein